jgi:hypothetical protein
MENYETLLRESKTNNGLEKWTLLTCPYDPKPSRYNTYPIKITIRFFIEIEKLKYTWMYKRPQ